MVGMIDPMETYKMSVSEFLRRYKRELSGEFEHVRVVDKRPDSPTVDFLYGDRGYEEHRCLFLMDGKIIPLDFSYRKGTKSVA